MRRKRQRRVPPAPTRVTTKPTLLLVHLSTAALLLLPRFLNAATARRLSNSLAFYDTPAQFHSRLRFQNSDQPIQLVPGTRTVRRLLFDLIGGSIDRIPSSVYSSSTFSHAVHSISRDGMGMDWLAGKRRTWQGKGSLQASGSRQRRSYDVNDFLLCRWMLAGTSQQCGVGID